MKNYETKRVKVVQKNGCTVYQVDAWPGWDDIIYPLINFVIVFAFIGAILYYFNIVQLIGHGINSTINSEWFGKLISSVVTSVAFAILSSAFGISLIIALILAIYRLLQLPYILLYNLSPKQFWLESQTLHHKTLLLGFIPISINIPFGRIVDIELDHPGDLYMIKALYEMKLPKFIFVILVHWSEKLTQRRLTVVNGIRTVIEAANLRDEIMERLTNNRQ